MIVAASRSVGGGTASEEVLGVAVGSPVTGVAVGLVVVLVLAAGVGSVVVALAGATPSSDTPSRHALKCTDARRMPGMLLTRCSLARTQREGNPDSAPVVRAWSAHAT
jgi:hypothetical protein